jgi:hypothetical protein
MSAISLPLWRRDESRNSNTYGRKYERREIFSRLHPVALLQKLEILVIIVKKKSSYFIDQKCLTVFLYYIYFETK